MDIELMQKLLFDANDPLSDYTMADFERDVNLADENYCGYKISLSYVNKSTNEGPNYATIGSSGFDLRANLPDNGIVIEKGGVEIIPTGLFFSIPAGYEIQVRPRSGLAAKNGVTVLNTPGTIDADYTGEIKIILINLGKENFSITHGDRIAQGIFAPVYGKNLVNLNQVVSIEENDSRGSNGFGSTGIK